MFSFPRDWFKQPPLAAKLVEHQHIQILLSHPKVQSLIKDAKFSQIIREKNIFK
jgi:hypothetical protein